jgi:hypothetical protein
VAATPRSGHAPIVMHRVDGCPSKVGEFKWRVTDGKRVLVLAIPYGRDRYVLSEWTIDHKNDCNAQWSWDKNEEKPTLHPSLHAVGVWHGWVRNGMLREA